MPIDYKKYHPLWKNEIRPRILKRANHKCEVCGVENYALGIRWKDGRFQEVGPEYRPGMFYCGHKVFKIVLTIAHLNHDIKDNRDENLKAMCQYHHLKYDQQKHLETRMRNKEYKTQTISIKNLLNS